MSSVEAVVDGITVTATIESGTVVTTPVIEGVPIITAVTDTVVTTPVFEEIVVSVPVADIEAIITTGVISGLPGPQGPPGPALALGYRHYQSFAATTWTIHHNLSFYPNVTVLDSTGEEIVPGKIAFPDATTMVLSFSAAVGGEAFCS